MEGTNSLGRGRARAGTSPSSFPAMARRGTGETVARPRWCEVPAPRDPGIYEAGEQWWSVGEIAPALEIIMARQGFDGEVAAPSGGSAPAIAGTSELREGE